MLPRLWLALLPIPLLAQDFAVAPLSQLASSPDGSYVLFQSRFGRKGLQEAGREKIFRWDARGIRLEVDRPGRDVVDPQVSSDGVVFAFTIRPSETVFRGATGEFNSPGRWKMSRNGAWAIEPTAKRRMNLRTRGEVAVACEDPLLSVTNDGRVLCGRYARAALWSPERSQPLDLGTGFIEPLAVDPSGTVLVLIDSSVQLMARRVSDGKLLASCFSCLAP